MNLQMIIESPLFMGLGGILFLSILVICFFGCFEVEFVAQESSEQERGTSKAYNPLLIVE